MQVQLLERRVAHEGVVDRRGALLGQEVLRHEDLFQLTRGDRELEDYLRSLVLDAVVVEVQLLQAGVEGKGLTCRACTGTARGTPLFPGR